MKVNKTKKETLTNLVVGPGIETNGSVRCAELTVTVCVAVAQACRKLHSRTEKAYLPALSRLPGTSATAPAAVPAAVPEAAAEKEAEESSEMFRRR